MSPPESSMNEVSGSLSVFASPDESPCLGCNLSARSCRCLYSQDHVSEDVAPEIRSYEVCIPSIYTAREARDYEHHRRQVKKAAKRNGTRQRKQAARLRLKPIVGSGLNSKIRKEIGITEVKRVRGRSVAKFLLEDGIFGDDYAPQEDTALGDEESLHEESVGWKHWTTPCGSFYDSGLSDDVSDYDGHLTPPEFEFESRLAQFWRDHSWRSPRIGCSTCDSSEYYDDDYSRNFTLTNHIDEIFWSTDSPSPQSTAGDGSGAGNCLSRMCRSTCEVYDDDYPRNLTRTNRINAVFWSTDSPSPQSTVGDGSEAEDNLTCPNPSLSNISAAREVRAYEYDRDQVKRKAKFAKFRERKQAKTMRDEGPKPKGRKQDRLRIVGPDFDSPEDVEEESSVPLEVSLSSILPEEPPSRPFEMSDLVQTVQAKKGKEPGFEFVPQVRAVIALDDPVQELDFEDSQWEHVWNDDLLDEQLSYASFQGIS